MNRFVKSTLLVVALLFLALVIEGCDDGRHTSLPPWSLSPGAGGQFSEDISEITLECVDVVDYRDPDFIDDTDITVGSNEEDESDIPEELTPSDITTKQVSAIDAMYKLSGVKAAGSIDDIRKCIKTEIDDMRASGSEFYWNNRTWVLSRDKLSREPEKSSVDVIQYMSCSQVQSADCLLIN